jgi:hypothetical protein
MKYEGGSLPLDQHDKLTTYVGMNQVVFVQGRLQPFVVLVKSIDEISYGNDVHRRVGLAAGVAVLTLGVGALLLFVKTKKHYVGIVWTDKPVAAPNATVSAAAPTAAATDGVAASTNVPTSTATSNTNTGKGGVVFKVGKGDYRGFMAALEGVAGIKAVNADAVGSGGTSK